MKLFPIHKPSPRAIRTISYIVAALFAFSILHAVASDAHWVGAKTTTWEDGKHCLYNSTILDHTYIAVQAQLWTETTYYYGGSWHKSCDHQWARDPQLIRVQGKMLYRRTSSQAWAQCYGASFGWRYNTSRESTFLWTKSWQAGTTCGVGQYKLEGTAQTYYGDTWHGKAYTTIIHTF